MPGPVPADGVTMGRQVLITGATGDTGRVAIGEPLNDLEVVVHR